MAVTQDSLRQRVRTLVYTAMPSARGYEDVLQGSLAAGGTSATVLDGTAWSKGDIVDFPDGDQAVVTAISTNTLTLRRGAGATAHSDGDILYRNPRFSVNQIDYAIDHVVQDLFPDVYRIATVSDTYAPDEQWYPISDTDLMEVLTVYYEDDDYLIPTPVPVWSQRRGVDTTDFTQGQGLFIPGSQGMDTGDTFYVVYRAGISAVTQLLDRQEPMVATGAVYNLLGGATVARTHDPGRHTDRTVQPGQDSRDSIWFLREYLMLRRREELRLGHDEDRLPKNFRAERARRFRA